MWVQRETEDKNDHNFLLLLISIPFAMWFCSSAHQEMKSISLPFESGLDLTIALTNGMKQKSLCASPEPRTQRPYTLFSLSWNPSLLPHEQVQLIGCSVRDREAQLSQPKPFKASQKQSPNMWGKCCLCQQSYSLEPQLITDTWVGPKERSTQLTCRLVRNTYFLCYYSYPIIANRYKHQAKNLEIFVL